MQLAPSASEEIGSEIPSLQEPPKWSGARWAKGRRLAEVALKFCVGQGAVQALGVLGGLLLVRYLSVEGYAQYGLATAFQSVVAVLMDFGFAATIIPLVGGRRDDKSLVGRYVRSAKYLRDRSFFLLAPIATGAFLAVMHKHHWSWTVQTMLIVSVLVSLYSGGKMSYFSAPLLLFGRLSDFYMPQAITAAMKLALYGLLAVVGGLNSWVAAGLSAIGVALNGQLLEKASRRFVTWPERECKTTNREVLRYVLPAAPATVFTAFQSQISLFLVSMFGGTFDLAQVAALGRIAQIFTVLMTFNFIVVEPYIARLSRERLAKNFAGIFLAACLGCTPLVLLAFWYPQAYLWLLGRKYANLAPYMGWLIFGNCVNYVSGVLWVMNRGRKWLFWSGTAAEILLLLVVQTAFLAIVGVRTVGQAVMFTFTSSFCYLAAHGYVTVYGFTRPPSPPEAAIVDDPAPLGA